MHQTDLTLSMDACDAIRRLAHAAQVTTLTVVQAAWSMLLMRWTGRSGAAFGLVESGRGRNDRVAGCLVTTVPFQVRMDDIGNLRSSCWRACGRRRCSCDRIPMRDRR